MMNYRILTLSAMLMTAGCVSVSHTVGDGRWFNASLPIHLQHTLYHQERAYCAQAADQWIPLPDVTFGFGGVRHINGAPNVSVEGNQTAVTTGPINHSLVTGSSGSEVGFWKTVAASSVKSYRESRQERQCMTSLGWLPTNETWDGTPSHLNETIDVNRAVMDSVDAGYSHPLLGGGVMTLIDMRNSQSSTDGVVIHTTEIPLYAPEKRTTCVYELESSYFSTGGFVRCSGGTSQPVKVSSSSPIAHWIREYF
jgi:hypothetical protein